MLNTIEWKIKQWKPIIDLNISPNNFSRINLYLLRIIDVFIMEWMNSLFAQPNCGFFFVDFCNPIKFVIDIIDKQIFPNLFKNYHKHHNFIMNSISNSTGHFLQWFNHYLWGSIGFILMEQVIIVKGPKNKLFDLTCF